MRTSILTFSIFSLFASADAGEGKVSVCPSTPPATCYPDECTHCYCLGPENYQVNPDFDS